MKALIKELSQLQSQPIAETTSQQSAETLVDEQLEVQTTDIISASFNPDISKLAIKSITDYVEQTAVESEITPVLENLTEELKQIKPEISTLAKKLDTTISHLLQQLLAVGVRKQQETIAHAVKAIVNYVGQSSVESTLNPQPLQTLSKQLCGLSNRELDAAIRQLETFVAGYQAHLQQQTVAQAVEAIVDYGEQTAVNKALDQAVEQLTQNLTAPGKSELPQQLQQLSEVIEQCHQQMEAHQTMNPPVINSAPKRKSLNVSRVNQDNLKAFKAIANSVRDIPLEEVAERLGLERDRRDKHKWKGVGQTISINGQKFYDHLAQEGGYGAIDLVMHVQGRNFKEAVDWLSNGISELSVPQEHSRRGKPSSVASSPQPQKLQEPQPFQPPVPDENKWQEVKHYLVQQRGLPVSLVDDLHSSGKIYAAGLEPEVLEKLSSKGYSYPEAITNAVFLRHNLAQEPTGASLRGVSEGSSFKGLATGSNRDNGWFSFTTGEGQLERIVLVESAIDAMSAAALAKQPVKTMFISTDGAGSVPVDWLQQQQGHGIQIIAAHDADRTGEEMAWRLAAEIPAISRATPTRGNKDWNEQLLGSNKSSLSIDSPVEWQRVAQALGKPVSYINRIKSVTEAGKALPQEAKSAMQEDFSAYSQTSNDLWQWHKTAALLGESEVYLKRITEVAISFHHLKQPTPLSQTSLDSMQLDQQKLAYRLRYQDLQRRVRQYPKFENSPTKEVDIGIALLVIKESTDSNDAGRVLAQSDQLKEWKVSLPEDEYMVKGKAYIHQVYEQAQQLREMRSLHQQQQQKRDLGLEL